MALSVVMVGALIYVKQDLGVISSEPIPGAELDLAMLAGLVANIAMGPGPIALDHQVGLEPSESVQWFAGPEGRAQRRAGFLRS